jgi:hypothetical protein
LTAPSRATALKSEPRIFLSVSDIGGLKIGQPDESMTHINFVVKKLFEKMRINNPHAQSGELERVGQIP